MEQLLHMLSVLFSTPWNSPSSRHPSTCMQTHSDPEERVVQMCRDHCQYPSSKDLILSLFFLPVDAHIFPPFNYKLSDLVPWPVSFPYHFYCISNCRGLGEALHPAKAFRCNMLFLMCENRDTSPWWTMSRKTLAANKIFFQASSFSWICNNFIAIQIWVYKEACLPSTWQKPAEAALWKYKWEKKVFPRREECHSGLETRWKAAEKDTWISSAGQFSLQWRLFEVKAGQKHIKSWSPEHR